MRLGCQPSEGDASEVHGDAGHSMCMGVKSEGCMGCQDPSSNIITTWIHSIPLYHHGRASGERGDGRRGTQNANHQVKLRRKADHAHSRCNRSTQTPMRLKGDSGDGDERSYQVPSKVQGEAGYACAGRKTCEHGGVHGGTGGRFSKIHWACIHCTRCSRVAYSCSLEQSCRTTHVGRMEVVRMTGDGGLRSYQVPSKVHG